MTWANLLLLPILGACVGSFAATAGLRMATGRSWATGRSACDGCGRRLNFAETAPVISYLQVRGRCASCGSLIDPAHVTGEIFGALLLPLAVVLAPPPVSALLFTLAMTLYAAAVADLKAHRLPNALTGLTAIQCLTLAALSGFERLLLGVVAAIATIAVIQALRWLGEKHRGEPGMGLGDVKLAGALALWLGAGTPWAVTWAAGLGLLAILFVRPERGRIAFGPFIAAASFSVGLVQEYDRWPIVA